MVERLSDGVRLVPEAVTATEQTSFKCFRLPHPTDRYLMRELERNSQPLSADAVARPGRLAIIGRGRLGSALATALRQTGQPVIGPLPRGAAPTDVDTVLVCVPDAEIAGAASLVPAGPRVGHCSGATGLEVLAPHEAFSLHPLTTVTGDGAAFGGAVAAVSGSTAGALALARALAVMLQLRPIVISPRDRAAYHAAASIASNFLITLEAAAERLAATAGIERDQLLPLVRATVENWARLGPERALTGPVARGDEVTVSRQRDAVAERTPELLGLFDALVDATRSLAAEPVESTSSIPLEDSAEPVESTSSIPLEDSAEPNPPHLQAVVR
jgi:predicted short-subunit dehydrogenase-like oxidoreductase (DUF2520 family)